MRWFRAPILMAVVTLPILSAPLATAFDASDSPPSLTTSREGAVEPSLILPAGTIMRVASAERVKPSRLYAGDELWTELPRALFLRDRRALPSATRVRLTVDQVRRVKADADRPRGWSSFLRRPLARLAPRHQYVVSFRSAQIVMADGLAVPFKPSLLEVRDGARVEGGGKASAAGASAGRRGSTFILRLDEAVALPSKPEAGPEQTAANPSQQIETRARLMLLAPLSASKNREGETFVARVLEPLWLGNRLLVPEGSTVQGRIAWRRPPRRLRRAGSMRLSFGKLNLPEGDARDISASLLAVEALPSPRMTLDAEGTLRARAATRKRLAMDLGMAYLVGKVTDDLFEEGLKAGVSAAASGTVTTSVRYLGMGAGLACFLAQRGRDVTLPEYTELEIVIARPDPRGEKPAPRSDRLPD